MALIEIPDRLAKLPLIKNLAIAFSNKVKATGKTGNNEQLIMKIVQEFTDLSRKEIDDWRTALNAWEDPYYPKTYMLQDLYQYLDPDAQLGTSKDIRMAVTLGKKNYIRSKKTGKEIPEKTILFNKSWFFFFCWEFLDTILKGYTAAQLVDAKTMKFDFLPRRNTLPQKDFFTFSVYQELGISLNDPAIKDNIIFIKHKHKYGILNDIVPNLIWKKNAKAAWNEFAQKFGIPLVSATTTKRDKKEIDKMDLMLKNLGMAASAVFPVGTTITIHDSATKGDPYNIWLKGMEYDDKMIAKRLLGGSMIIDDGSSKSQSEVHERTLKEVISFFDKKIISFTVNDFLLPMMARNGYPITDDDEFYIDDSEQLSMKDHWSIVKDALDKYDIPEDWVSRTFNIPIIGKKEVTPNFNKASKEKAAALEAKGIMLPNYKYHACTTHAHAHAHFPEANFITDLLSSLSEKLINEIWKGADTLINEVLKSIASYSYLRDGLFDNWSNRAEISYDSPDVHCLAMMEYNLFEFSRLKEAANIFAVNQLLIDENGERRNFASFRNVALKYFKNANLNWLETEYNQAIAVSQNARSYFQFMQQRTTVTNYVQWNTMEDERVRLKHQQMDKLVFRLDDPSGLTIWPPKDWGCRCWMTQYLGVPEHITTNDEGLKILGIEKGSALDVNRARIEQVFTANEMYIRKLGIDDESSKLTFNVYDLKKFDDIKSGFEKLKLDNSITPQNAVELFKPVADKIFMGFNDYLKRKMILKREVFDFHLQEKYTTPQENRHQLFPFIKDVLNKPDEVYFIRNKKGNKIRYQTNYIKFYNDDVLIVNTSTGSEDVEINTWYKMKADEAAIRKGYLVYQNKKP